MISQRGFLASPNQVLTHAARVTMRAWPVARSIFDAPYVREANERRADNKLDNARAAAKHLWWARAKGSG